MRDGLRKFVIRGVLTGDLPILQPLPLWQKAGAGLTAGGLGALVGSPADLTLIRMQADSTLPMASRRNYKGVGDAMVSSVCC